jgi:hypothetical protein
MLNIAFTSTALELSVQADDKIIAQCNGGPSIARSFNSPCVSQPSERREEKERDRHISAHMPVKLPLYMHPFHLTGDLTNPTVATSH